MPYHGHVTSYMVECVFIDTQVFVSTGFGYTSKSFQALRKHLESRRLRLVLTDITVNEVHAQIEHHVAKEMIAHRTFANAARALFNCSIPEIKTALQKLDAAVVTKNLCDQFDAFLAESHASVINTSELKVGDALKKYFAGTPPFGPAENKRYEFPDAFAIEALIQWAYECECVLFVVSGDKLFREACEKQKFPLIPKETLNDLLDHIASDNEQFAAILRRETMNRIFDIEKAAKHEFEDRFYWVDDHEGDAEVSVIDLTPAPEPLIIEMDVDSATLHLDFTATYSAHLSYVDSSTSLYSKGKLVYGDEKEETVRREHGLTAEIFVTYKRMDPDTFEIENIWLIDPSDGFGIKSKVDHGWPDK
jgi:PIN domain